MKSLTVGVIQTGASTSKESALGILSRLSRSIGEADILVIPEYAMLDPTNTPLEKLRSESEGLEDPGPWMKALTKLAVENGSCVIGTLFRPAEDGRVYNSVVTISRDGNVRGIYDKTHLFDAYGYKESSKIRPGGGLFTPIELCGARIGLAVCFEIRFPEVIRYQVLRGAEIVVIPAAWYRGPLKEEALSVLARARSHENTVYTVVAALSGEHFTGRSIIVNPLGYIERDLGPAPTYEEHRLDGDKLAEARRMLPLLELRRDDLYHP